MKFAFYVSNNATTLKKILAFASKHNLKFLDKISFIIIDNNENIELKKIVKKLNIELIEVDLKNKKKKNTYISNFINEKLSEYKIDYLFIYCDKILRGKLLKNYKNKIINFHPAILPSFKGLMAIDQAINSNAFLLGNTAHFIDENIDEGIMLMQSIMPRHLYRDYDDVLDMQVYMLIQIIIWILDNRLSIDNGLSYIKDARYKPDFFIPNLEDNILINEFNNKYDK